MTVKLWWLLALAVPVMAATGCAPSNKDMLQFLRQHEHEVSAIEYRLGIPDAVEISAPRVLEIDGQSQTLQPDGKITLKLLGEVKIVGMTAREVAAKLEVLLSRYYVDPKVSVRVAAYASKSYYVYGPTISGGEKPYTGHDTLLDAVLASGVDYRAWTSRIEVIRPTVDAEDPKRIVVDVNRMIREGDWRQNILLEPDDVVYVPPTPLAWVGLKVRELLDPVSPAIQAYQAPATLMNANDVYNDDDDNNNAYRTRGARSVIRRLR